METLQNILNECRLKGYFSIGQVIDFTEKCLDTKRQFGDFEDNDSSMQPTRGDAIKLSLEFVSSQSNGTPEQYHNYAVILARAEEWDLTCDVLLCGLKRYGENIDLLADYLLYATKSSKDVHYERCNEIFEKLQSHRPLFWNWRAYDFSIDYLLNKIDRGPVDKSCIKSLCLELAQEFQKRIPGELGYIAEYTVYSRFQEDRKATNALRKALNKNNIHVVQSAIILAEINVQCNNPQEALKCVHRIMTDIADTNLRTTPAHIYILSIISKTSQLMSSINAEQGIDTDLVRDIFNDWIKVKKFEDVDKHLFNTTKMLVKLAEVNSNTKFDDGDEL